MSGKSLYYTTVLRPHYVVATVLLGFLNYHPYERFPLI